MSEPEAKKPEDWGAEYQSRRQTYEAYTEALERLIPQLLEKSNISYVQVDGRTKEVSNFVSKLWRKGEKYEDPLEEVTDLSGIRIVLYYLDDVERVGEIIRDQFTVDDDNSVDKGAILDPDRFGYLSSHYVVKPSRRRSDLMEWTEFAELWAEIQVRTVLQHAWGAISRKLAYADVREAPRDLQRSLNRLSALLELADDEFVDIRVGRENIEQQYDREVKQKNLDLEIDESSLEIYLRESGVSERIERMAQEAGSPSEKSKQSKFDDEVIEEIRQEKTRSLLAVLKDLGITRIAELDSRLGELWVEIPAFMERVNESYTDDDQEPISSFPSNWLVLILLWSKRASAQELSEVGYVDDLVDVVVATYDTSPPSAS